MAVTNPKLSPIQVHFLRFFNERSVSEQETKDMQTLIAQYYAQKADALMDKIWAEKKLDGTKMIELLEVEH
jgi:hypothetical protein